MIEIIINIIWAVIAIGGIVCTLFVVAPLVFAFFIARELDK